MSRSSFRTLPFLGLSPLDDVYWMILLIPFWWILGIEQFIYPVILSVAVLKRAFNQSIKVDLILILYMLFLVVYVFSAFYIDRSVRFLTYIRNFGAYYSITLLLILFYNEDLSKYHVTRIINAFIIAMSFAGFVGLLGVLNIYRGEFTSVIGYFLPSFIKESSYGGVIAYRTTGLRQWFIIVGEYFRVSSIFLFSTFYASALAIVLPLFWYKYKVSLSVKSRFVFVLLIALLFVNLIFTTGRVAMASLLVASLFIFLFHHQPIVKKKRLKAFLGFSILLFFVLLFFFQSEVATIVEGIVFAREGSASARMSIYQATVQGFLERPFFGWGTERDVPGLYYPAGSHSNYLGILYKQGLSGFLLMVMILFFTWKSVFYRRTNDFYFHRTVKGVFIIVVLNGLTDVLDLDATTFLLAWTLLGIGIYGNK